MTDQETETGDVIGDGGQDRDPGALTEIAENREILVVGETETGEGGKNRHTKELQKITKIYGVQ